MPDHPLDTIDRIVQHRKNFASTCWRASDLLEDHNPEAKDLAIQKGITTNRRAKNFLNQADEAIVLAMIAAGWEAIISELHTLPDWQEPT